MKIGRLELENKCIKNQVCNCQIMNGNLISLLITRTDITVIKTTYDNMNSNASTAFYSKNIMVINVRHNHTTS